MLTEHSLEKHNSLPYPCSWKNCDRVRLNAFGNDKDLKTHVKKDHVSPFQCENAGCDRKGSNGWLRKAAMIRHMKKAHGTKAQVTDVAAVGWGVTER